MKGNFLKLVLAMAIAISAGAAMAQNPKAAFARASEALKAGDFAKAAEAYVEAERTSGSKEGRSNAANGIGFVHMKQRHWGEAIPHFTRATQINPANKTAWNNLGMCQLKLFETGQDTTAINGAVTAFEQASRLDPAAASNTLYESENLKLARALAAAAQTSAAAKPVELPANGTFQEYRGIASKAEAAGDLTTAQAALVRAEAVAPARKGKAVAANMLGLLALKLNNPAAAVEALRRSTTLDAGSKLAWNNLGVALMKLLDATPAPGGRELAEEAVAAFKHVAEIDATYRAENLAWAEGVLAEFGPAPTPVSATGTGQAQ